MTKNPKKSNKKLWWLIAAAAVVVIAIAVVCIVLNAGPKYPAEIPNGDFELDHEISKWNGWTRSDAAFNVRGLVGDEKLNGAVMEKSGSLYFGGTAGGNQTMRGTLTSDVFNLGGNGLLFDGLHSIFDLLLSSGHGTLLLVLICPHYSTLIMM